MGKHGIDYKRVRVYFIYSFLLEFKEGKDFSDLTNSLKLDPFKPGKLPQKPDDVKIGKWFWGEPPSRKGLAPTLRVMRSSGDGKKLLYPYSIYRKSEKNKKAVVRSHAKGGALEVKINTTTRIADSGCGVITISVETKGEKEIKLADIYQIIELQELTELERTREHRIDIGGRSQTIFQLFLEEINKIREETHEAAEWIDREVVNPNPEKQPCQNPFTVIACEVESPIQEKLNEQFHDKLLVEELERDNRKHEDSWFTSFYWWNGDSKHLHREAASLMLRMVNGQHVPLDRIPEECQDPNNPQRLRNFAWDSRIFIGFQRRACLLMCPSFKHRPAQFLLPSLLDMMEMLRTRWHGAIVINALLDRDMEYIKEFASKENLIALERFVRRRRQFAFLLRDPIPYAFEGASITEISELAQNKLWVKELLDKTAMKLDTVSKLMSEQAELIRAKEYLESLDHENNA